VLGKSGKKRKRGDGDNLSGNSCLKGNPSPFINSAKWPGLVVMVILQMLLFQDGPTGATKGEKGPRRPGWIVTSETYNGEGFKLLWGPNSLLFPFSKFLNE